MLRTVNPQPTIWDAILPEQCLGMVPRLAEVDRLLDDPRFFEPFRPFFAPRRGRPSVPMEVYLRMMFLRFEYDLGFEALCREVTDSLMWRRFCRISLGEPVPHPSTLEKITSRCGPAVVDGLNDALLAKAHENKLIKTDKIRADTTVVPANIGYPTDSGLLAKGVAKMRRGINKLKAMGLATRTASRDRSRSVRRRAHDVAVWLRRRTGDAKEEVYAITAELAVIADAAVADARNVARNARRGLHQAGRQASGKAWAVLADLERTAELVERIAAQTRIRLAGEIPDGASRIVSLHDADARPIATGRLGKPIEFGYKAQVADNTDGIVLDHVVMMGNPPDAPLLAPAMARIKARFGRAPNAVTADRGYGEASVDAELKALGVKTVAIPRKGKPGVARTKVQRRRGFVSLMKWRTGSEGRISCLKRDAGWARTLLDGMEGAETWCGWGVLAHNAKKISTLMNTQQHSTSPDNEIQFSQTTRRKPTDPPTAGTAA
jgi:transposase, IS5 family